MTPIQGLRCLPHRLPRAQRGHQTHLCFSRDPIFPYKHGRVEHRTFRLSFNDRRPKKFQIPAAPAPMAQPSTADQLGVRAVMIQTAIGAAPSQMICWIWTTAMSGRICDKWRTVLMPQRTRRCHYDGTTAVQSERRLFNSSSLRWGGLRSLHRWVDLWLARIHERILHDRLQYSVSHVTK